MQKAESVEEYTLKQGEEFAESWLVGYKSASPVEVMDKPSYRDLVGEDVGLSRKAPTPHNPFQEALLTYFYLLPDLPPQCLTEL